MGGRKRRWGWINAATLALGCWIALGGCADGELEVMERAPASFGDLGPGAQGDLCGTSADCQEGLRCLNSAAGSLCVQPCTSPRECSTGLCNPVSGSSVGWCAWEEGGLPGDGSHTPPGGAPEPPGDDPDPWADEPDPAPAPEDQGGAPEPPAGGDPEAAPAPQPEPAPEPPSGAEPQPQPEQPCVYPGGSQIGYNQTFPKLSWRTAYDASGQQTSFSMEDFYCDSRYDSYGSLLFVISAEWCSACPSYLRSVASQVDSLRSLGMMVVFVEAQDNSYQYPSSSHARQVLDRYVSGAAGLRVGDGDTQPGAGTLYNVVSSFPSAWVLRRSDMKMIADQARSNFTLDLAQIARENPPQGAPGAGNNGNNNNNPPQGSCQEEIHEPNNAHTSAPVIGATSFDGGVCDSAPDFYAVQIGGSWRLDLQFQHSQGDLDVYVWDIFNNQPSAVGSDSADDNESFTHAGWAVIGVLGYQGAQAPYRLTLTEL